MSEITVTIGGRDFEVACQPGEETFLRRAASILDVEASAVIEQLGRMPAERMLLLAGLMLADQIAQADAEPKTSEDLLNTLEELTEYAETLTATLESWQKSRSQPQG